MERVDSNPPPDHAKRAEDSANPHIHQTTSEFIQSAYDHGKIQMVLDLALVEGHLPDFMW